MHLYKHTVIHSLRMGEQLEHEAELIGVLHVAPFYVLDSLHIHMLHIDCRVEGKGRKYHDLVLRISARDVQGRVGLGKAELLGDTQGRIEIDPLTGHLGEDEV